MYFFAKNPKGWPVGSTKKRTKIDVSFPAAAVAAVAKAIKARKNKEHEEQQQTKNKFIKYRYAEIVFTLKDAVHDILLNGNVAFHRHGIPKSTLKDNSVKFESVANLLDIPFGDITREQYFGDIYKRTPPLLYMDDVAFISKTIVSRDNNNNGMGREDVVNLVMDLSQNNNRKKFEDNYDYLVYRNKLDGVKRDGRVAAAQPTTINRYETTVSKQWIWYSTLEETWNYQKRLNMEYGTGVVFDDVAEHLTGNIDDSCFMANHYGSIKIVASGSKKKTEKNFDDFRASITSFRGEIVLSIKGLSFFYQRETRLG